MIIHVGSKNPAKIGAVEDAFSAYPHTFPNLSVIGIDVTIEEFGHPKSLEETVDGAINRAKAAFPGADYSVGLEGGLMSVPHTKTGFMEVGVCAIFDGTTIHLGLSPAFEWPKEAFTLITEQGLDGSQAVKQIGLTNLEKVGAQNGVIEILTQGQTTRKEQAKASVLMALTHLLNPELF